MMNRPDLTPVEFVKRMQSRQVFRRWLIPLAACGMIAMAPIVIANMRAPYSSGQIAQDRVVQAQSQLKKNEAAIASKAALLSQEQRELQAEQHLTQHPDWNAVLTLITRQFDEQLMMTGFQLGDATDNRVRQVLGAAAADVPRESVWFILTGVAQANSDVPGLVMRLEALGLFERIVMTGAQREAIAGGSRTTFTLACKVQ